MQIKAITSLGKVIVGLGAILGVGSLVGYLFEILTIILSTVLSLALKVVVVIVAVMFVIWILKGIYDWLTK